MDFDRPESWALKYFASVSMIGSFGTPKPITYGAIDLEVELGWIPSLSEDQRRVGFVGNKVEDLNRNDIFGRLRARFGLPHNFAILVGFTPPIERNGVTPTLFDLAVERPFHDSTRWRLGLSAYGQIGTVEGDFICPTNLAGLDDPDLNPDDCHEASNDEVTLDYFGFAVGVTPKFSRERWEPYFSLSANYVDLGFQVNARYSVFDDRANLVTSGVIYAARLGLEYFATNRFRFSGELYFSPLEVQRDPTRSTEYDSLINARVLVGYSFR